MNCGDKKTLEGAPISDQLKLGKSNVQLTQSYLKGQNSKETTLGHFEDIIGLMFTQL